MSLRIRSGAQHPSATALTRFPVRLTPYRTQHFFPAYHRLYTMAAVRAYYCDQDDGHDTDDVAALAQEFEGMGLTGSTGQSRQLKRRAANVSEKLGGQETRSHANKELDVGRCLTCGQEFGNRLLAHLSKNRAHKLSERDRRDILSEYHELKAILENVGKHTFTEHRRFLLVLDDIAQLGRYPRTQSGGPETARRS